MKPFLFLTACLLLGFSQQPKSKLNGTYRVEFDKKYELQGFQLNFNEDTFTKVMPDAVSYKGPLDYGKFKTTIRVSKEENPIEIDNREIGKDTIKFSTKNKTDLSLTVNRGKLIRIKA